MVSLGKQRWRNSSAYRHWAEDIKKRDGCCMICGSEKKLNAHHINDASNHPDLRYDMDNGITLCRKCHVLYHILFRGGYRKKTTKKDFKKYRALVKYYMNLE